MVIFKTWNQNLLRNKIVLFSAMLKKSLNQLISFIYTINKPHFSLFHSVKSFILKSFIKSVMIKSLGRVNWASNDYSISFNAKDTSAKWYYIYWIKKLFFLQHLTFLLVLHLVLFFALLAKKVSDQNWLHKLTFNLEKSLSSAPCFETSNLCNCKIIRDNLYKKR